MSCAWPVAVLVFVSVLASSRLLAQEPQDPCLEEPLLARAAAELLLAHEERPSAEALTGAVRAAGSDAVGLHALFVPLVARGRQPRGTETGTETEREWLTALRARVDGQLSCGRAQGETGRLLLAVGRGAELAPIDPQARTVRGQLRPGFSDAELVIADAEGQLVRVGVGAQDLQKGVVLSADLAAPIKVQLVARGPSGPRPVAERELPAASPAAGGEPRASGAPAPEAQPAGVRRASGAAAGEALPSAGVAAADSRGPRERGARTNLTAASTANERRKSAAAAERGAKELTGLLLALRAERGRGALRDNRLLREAASDHASNVCAKGRVAHEVEAGEGPDARLAQAGLSARVLGEAIARADDTPAALHALENSPSHLYTLLDPRFTDFGVGVARDSAQKYCYVVLLCAWPRYVGKAKR